MSAVNQKEYLKRYLSKDKGKKKRKKAPKGVVQNRVKIIDDNIDVHEQVQTIHDIENETEDAPQVVAVIDDRPVELRLHDFNDASKWTTIDIKPEVKEEPVSPSRNSDYSPARERTNKMESPSRKGKSSDEDESPPRRSRKYNSDASPPRKGRTDRKESPKRTNSDDYSPPRKSKNYSSPPRRMKEITNPARRKDNGHSPQLTNNNHAIDDYSPPRKKQRPRSQRIDESPSRRNRNDEKYSKSSSNNYSNPPRRLKHYDSPPQMTYKNESPPGKGKWDQSPPRRQHSTKRSRWTSRSPIPEPAPSTSKSNKSTKTLDGKTAGLQNAKDLVKETANLRKREAKLFAEMSSEVSGANASTVMRDRKTGKIRDLEAEAQEKILQKEMTHELEEKYAKWGKGVKQTEDYKQKLEEAAYEMNKPLARYADDEDLERHLKEQERVGDPMLAYIKKKKREEAVTTSVKWKPEYMGEFMPNRYGIRPGHRWDGVDRSNGYEKKWFDAINKRNADREEAYRWNSEDM